MLRVNFAELDARPGTARRWAGPQTINSWRGAIHTSTKRTFDFRCKILARDQRISTGCGPATDTEALRARADAARSKFRVRAVGPRLSQFSAALGVGDRLKPPLAYFFSLETEPIQFGFRAGARCDIGARGAVWSARQGPPRGSGLARPSRRSIEGGFQLYGRTEHPAGWSGGGVPSCRVGRSGAPVSRLYPPQPGQPAIFRRPTRPARGRVVLGFRDFGVAGLEQLGKDRGLCLVWYGGGHLRLDPGAAALTK